jgi:hypothetical protein
MWTLTWLRFGTVFEIAAGSYGAEPEARSPDCAGKLSPDTKSNSLDGVVQGHDDFSMRKLLPCQFSNFVQAQICSKLNIFSRLRPDRVRHQD